MSSHVDDFNTRNKILTAKLLRQGYRYHKLRKAFSKFYRRNFDLLLFLLYINIKIGKKKMLNVRLAGGHLYGKQLFTWLSLVVSLIASFVLSFFPLHVLDESWDVIESVSEGFLTYS